MTRKFALAALLALAPTFTLAQPRAVTVRDATRSLHDRTPRIHDRTPHIRNATPVARS